jgi:hypothetical protein
MRANVAVALAFGILFIIWIIAIAHVEPACLAGHAKTHPR